MPCELLRQDEDVFYLSDTSAAVAELLDERRGFSWLEKNSPSSEKAAGSKGGCSPVRVAFEPLEVGHSRMLSKAEAPCCRARGVPADSAKLAPGEAR